MRFPKRDDLIEITTDKIFEYVGFPLYKVTPIWIEAKNSNGQIMSEFKSGYNYKWIIFDGTLQMRKEDINAKYYTFKSLVD